MAERSNNNPAFVKRSGLRGQGKLIDLVCGPGRGTFLLAKYFGEVMAIDLEPEMIDVAREKAEQLDVTNVRWMVGGVEDLDTPVEAFELVTIGEAFHRLNRYATGVVGL